jgi:hypothetical protein
VVSITAAGSSSAIAGAGGSINAEQTRSNVASSGTIFLAIILTSSLITMITIF